MLPGMPLTSLYFVFPVLGFDSDFLVFNFIWCISTDSLPSLIRFPVEYVTYLKYFLVPVDLLLAHAKSIRKPWRFLGLNRAKPSRYFWNGQGIMRCQVSWHSDWSPLIVLEET